MPTIIRKATNEDVEHMVDLMKFGIASWSTGIEEQISDWVVTMANRPYLYELIRMGDRLVLVAERDGEIIGMTLAFESLQHSQELGGKTLYFGSFYVRYRGEGTGTQLLDYLFAYADEYQFDWLLCETYSKNTTAISYFTSRGAEKYIEHDYDGVTYHSYRFALKPQDHPPEGY